MMLIAYSLIMPLEVLVPIFFHFDIDAFFAAVEVLLNPDLKGKPVIVGGTERRGVVSTASYEARRFGVHSAMSTAMAKQLCPNGIFIRGNFDAYRRYSRLVFDQVQKFSDRLEKVGIDEGYLDMTQSLEVFFKASGKSIDNMTLSQTALAEQAIEIAQEMKLAVYEATGLTISIGISYNKFLAKLASDWKKPNGLFIIAENEAQSLLDPLPLLKVHGLGKKSAAKLNALGLFTIKDLRLLGEANLSYIIGESWAKDLYPKLCGHDPRPITTHYERKSYGRETTFDEDLIDKALLMATLESYLEEIVAQVSKKSLIAKTLTIKIKYADFTQHTYSHSLPAPTDQYRIFYTAMHELLQTIKLEQPVRLIGVTLSNLTDNKAVQLSFFDF